MTSFLTCHAWLSPSGFRLFSHPHRGSFQLSLTVLVRYRSWDVFRIRSRCLPNSRPISNGRYSRKKIQNLKKTYLRDYNPLRYGIPAQFQFNLKGFVDQVLITPHLHLHYYREFSLFYTVFARCYSRYRILLSFPPPTKMFQFGGFPLQ